MKRTTANFVIDAAAFTAFVALMSTGLLLRYQLPPGSGDPTRGGTGHGAAERPISLLWEYTRHEWGELHYWLAVVLIGILAVHLLLHWRWIVCVVRGQKSDASGIRFGLGVVSLIAIVVLASLPLASDTREVPRSELQQEATDHASDVDAARPPDAKEEAEDGDLRGSMTLREVAQRYDVPIASLAEQLGLPSDVSPDARLGRLRPQYGFRMSDVRQIVQQESEP